MLSDKPQRGVWIYGALSLCVLAPLFFLSYGYSNHYASQLAHVPSMVFAWERYIPLWPCSIIPYWSIDLFYGLSLVLCVSKFELKQHVLRLVSAQLIAVSCFMLFPLMFSTQRPPVEGFFGFCFDVLMGFDQPYNQAPSLHIILLLILWDFYRRHLQHRLRWLVDLWSILIGISVLTTWQHHFIDVPTGLLVGAICLWLFPLQGYGPLRRGRQQMTRRHLQLAAVYAIGMCVCLAVAFYAQSWFLWLLYPAVSLGIVALAYLLRQPHVLQKQHDGSMTVASFILLAPYLVLAWLNSRFWTARHPEDSHILDVAECAIYLGRIPSQAQAKRYTGLYDCCAELPQAKQQAHYEAFYTLDLVPIQAAQFSEAVIRLQHVLAQPAQQQVLIFCALGYSRSSSILIAWMLKQGLVQSAEQGMQYIQQHRPWIVLKQHHLQQINQWYQDELA